MKENLAVKDEIIDVSREYEERYFADTLQIVSDNCSSLDAENRKLKADIEHMWDQYFAGDVEVRVSLDQAIAMQKEVGKSLAKNLRAGKKPYFGRIIFTEEGTGVKESLYIGRCGLKRGTNEQIVADWRAPISNIYYENGLGPCSFLSPDDEDINIDLELKRTFDIDGGRLIDFVDSDVVANDELLTKYLARNKQAVLGEIVATIQKEQNEIIRRSPYRNVIVQGAAGSGKTTVAMHRISYILYNYAELVSPSNFYIIGSNRMLLNYITGVLPELDVEGVRQMTMEEMFVHIIDEQWDEEKHRIAPVTVSGTKGTSVRFRALEQYCNELEQRYIIQSNVVLNRDCYSEGVENGESGVWNRSESRNTADYEEFENGRQKCESYPSCVMLLFGNYVSRFISSNPELSLQKKVLQLNEKLKDNLEYEFSSHGSRYTEKEIAAIRKAFNNRFGKPEYPDNIFKIYDDFLGIEQKNNENKASEDMNAVNKGVENKGTENKGVVNKGTENKGAKNKVREYDIYDLAALAYIYKRIVDVKTNKLHHHIVVDEAQDYGMMAYRALNFCFDECTYTVMGDISQNIRYDSGINNWDELKALLLKDPRDSFCTLRKSYRNTVEISEFATKILDHGSFEVYPVEPIIRHGDAPLVVESADTAFVADKCREWQAEGYNTIAIVTRTSEEAAELQAKLVETGLDVLENDPEKAEFGSGIMVLPVVLTKGLEFDAVLIYEPTEEKYPTDDRHAKLLYVAATRALHKLCIACRENLTGLIAEEVPLDQLKRVVIADPVDQNDDGLTPGERARLARKQKAADDDYAKREIMKKATSRTKALLEGEKKTDSGKNVLPEGEKKTNSEKNVLPEGEKKTNAGKKVQLEGETKGRMQGNSVSVGGSNKVMNVNGTAIFGKEVEIIDNASDSASLFAQQAEADFLKTPGHVAPALASKWITKQANGIYVQSRYGILRICPISASIIRISFCRGSAFELKNDREFKQFGMLKSFTQRENPKTLEISAANVGIIIDKQTGAITYKDGKGRELLREKNIEPRIIAGEKAQAKCVTSFMPKNTIDYHAYNPLDNSFKFIGNTARFVNSEDCMPMILVKDSFAIIVANSGRTAFDNRAGQGTALVSEGETMDYYFVTAASTEELLTYYEKLSAK